jgi:hydrogenase maturation factor
METMNGKNISTLGLGKVNKEILERSVFPFLPLVHGPELNGGVFQSRGRMIVAHSPSIGVPIYSLGFFGFHYAASNVASKFAIPRYLVLGIYLPLNTREKELMTIVKGVGDEASKYKVSVVAGQTATYYGLEIPLLTVTCLGKETRKSKTLTSGDLVYVIGKIGAEAVWLKKTSEKKAGENWRKLTPLPAALRLQKVKSVKLMHDISEGGLKNALYELMMSTKTKILVDSNKICYADELELLGVDILLAPSYGSLLIVSEPDGESDVVSACNELGIQCSLAGQVEEGSGLHINGEKIGRPERTSFDRIYGSFKKD